MMLDDLDFDALEEAHPFVAALVDHALTAKEVLVLGKIIELAVKLDPPDDDDLLGAPLSVLLLFAARRLKGGYYVKPPEDVLAVLHAEGLDVDEVTGEYVRLTDMSDFEGAPPPLS